jgi:hypothetical protein
MNEAKIKKTGLLLFITGIIVISITMGGFYLNQNPQIIAKLINKRDAARRDELGKILLVAPDSCASISPSLFETACNKVSKSFMDMEKGLFNQNHDWAAGFNQQALTCMRESFRITNAFKLEYNGYPASELKDLETDESVVSDACYINTDLGLSSQDLKTYDVKQVIDIWYQLKYSNGNYFGL